MNIKDVDINEVIEKSLAGDSECICELTRRFYPLIVSSMNRYRGERVMDSDDLVQEGYVMLLKCLKDYDRSMGVHFIGYLKSKLKYMYMNIARDTRVYASLDEPVHSDENNSACVVDLIEDFSANVEDSVIKNMECEHLYDCIAKLSDRERQIIVWYCLYGINMHSIAKLLGITFRTVANTKYRAMVKLRKMLSHPGVNYERR